MAKRLDLDGLYDQARAALLTRDHDRARDLLTRILAEDEDYKDASRLLARAVRLKRRRWTNDPRLWGPIIAAAVIGVLIWLIPKIPLRAPIQIAAPAASVTNAATSTAAASPTSTPVPLAWMRIHVGQDFPRDTITTIVIDPKDPELIYVGTRNAAIFKSLDGGLSWQPAHRGLGAAWVSTLVIDPQDSQTLYAGVALGGVYRTTDGGANWIAINQ
jgi:hypothetical protein